MKYYMGIDGGGTKTKFVLADETGEIKASCTGGACFYLQVGFDALTELMREGAEEVIRIYNEEAAGDEAPITKDDIACVCAGLAGYDDVAADNIYIEKAVKKGLGDMPLLLVNDCVIALAGALEGAEGICMIAGTGSIAYGYSKESGTMRCGGCPHVLGGDEGSGYWLGCALLREFRRQSDGRDERTLLYSRVRDVLGLKTDDEMVTRVAEDWGFDRTKIASLAPVVSELCDEGDPFAKNIVGQAAKELSDLAVALYGRLGFSEKDEKQQIPVSGAGSIFKMGSKLKGPLTEILEAHGMTWREPTGTPEEGAVLLAMREASKG